MGQKLAFMRKLEDGRWCVVIVGNMQRETAQVLDANIFSDEAGANEWRDEQIGAGSEVVYRAPTEH